MINIQANIPIAAHPTTTLHSKHKITNTNGDNGCLPGQDVLKILKFVTFDSTSLPSNTMLHFGACP